jgi:hypothetical protein
MRRLVLAAAVCLGIQLILPLPAQAWWGWWDELSGAGPFWGWELETRLACFGQNKPKPTSALGQAAAEHLKSAYERLQALVQTIPELDSGREKPKPDPESKKLATQVSNLFRLSVDALAAAPAPLTVMNATSLKTRVSEFTPNIRTLRTQCLAKAGFECSSQQLTIIDSVVEQLDAAETVYTVAQEQARTYALIVGSAGVTYSACPVERDVHRHASINMNFRLLHSYNDRGRQYAGGNETRLATLVPTVAWRPLYGIGKDWADWIDVSAGAGVYWLTSDGSKPGGFDAISGVIFEPLRLDAHLPSAVTEKGFWGALAGAASFRVGLAVFPAGFRANAFGTTEKPEQSERIPAEWVPNWAIFVDPSRVIYWLSTRPPRK